MIKKEVTPKEIMLWITILLLIWQFIQPNYGRIILVWLMFLWTISIKEDIE